MQVEKKKIYSHLMVRDRFLGKTYISKNTGMDGYIMFVYLNSQLLFPSCGHVWLLKTLIGKK